MCATCKKKEKRTESMMGKFFIHAIWSNFYDYTLDILLLQEILVKNPHSIVNNISLKIKKNK